MDTHEFGAFVVAHSVAALPSMHCDAGYAPLNVELMYAATAGISTGGGCGGGGEVTADGDGDGGTAICGGGGGDGGEGDGGGGGGGGRMLRNGGGGGGGTALRLSSYALSSAIVRYRAPPTSRSVT